MIWFIGIEEAGGSEEPDVLQHLAAWQQRGERELEDAPTFYPASGNSRWHRTNPDLQASWKQLVRMVLVARGQPDPDSAIRAYQRTLLGASQGDLCLAELLPLPSPTMKEWRYAQWSNLEWLRSREDYQERVIVQRACGLARRIERHRPQVVVFYGSSFQRFWAAVAGGAWNQAIPHKLMGLERDGMAFFVTKHPAAPELGSCGDKYFREIGRFFHREHQQRFSSHQSKRK